MTEPSKSDPAWERVGRLAELGVMTASLLHEVRQPLFAIKALVELELAADVSRGPRLRRVLEQIDVMEELLGNYGLLGRQDDELVVFDIAGPVGLAIDMLGHKARQGACELAVVNADGPVWVHARAGAIRQILVNLVHNALDAVAGRPARRVAVVVARDADGVVVEVRDTGGGIDASALERVFEPFFTTKAEGHGTGLGLYIARSLAREAGGELQVRTSGPQGTVVALRLPVAEP